MIFKPETHDAAPRSRLVAKVAWALKQAGRYECLSDFTGALKDRLRALRIPQTADDINAAYRLIESNHALITAPSAGVARATPVEATEPTSLTASEARDLYRAVMAHCAVSEPERTRTTAPVYFPNLVEVTPWRSR